MSDALEIIQGSDAWKAIKAGKVSASRISDVMAKGAGKTRASYMAEIVVERLTGAFTESYQSPAMKRGTELEPQARAAYSFLRGVEVELVGFVHHPRIAMSGASPDARVGVEGLVQFKCPEPHTHLEYLEDAPLPKAYRDQVQWEMACDGRQWCDFASFCPAWPAGMDLHVRRIARDDAYIAEIEAEVERFLADVDAKVAALRARYGEAA
jgi:hypothetical protein